MTDGRLLLESMPWLTFQPHPDKIIPTVRQLSWTAFVRALRSSHYTLEEARAFLADRSFADSFSMDHSAKENILEEEYATPANEYYNGLLAMAPNNKASYRASIRYKAFFGLAEEKETAFLQASIWRERRKYYI